MKDIVKICRDDKCCKYKVKLIYTRAMMTINSAIFRKTSRDDKERRRKAIKRFNLFYNRITRYEAEMKKLKC